MSTLNGFHRFAESARPAKPKLLRTPRMTHWVLLAMTGAGMLVATLPDWSPEQWILVLGALGALGTGIIGALVAGIVKIIQEVRLNRTSMADAAKQGAKDALSESPLPSSPEQMKQFKGDIAKQSATATVKAQAESDANPPPL